MSERKQFKVDENTGFLFVNEEKEKSENEKLPDFTGVINISGTEFQLAAWKHKSESTGKGFLAIRSSARDEYKKKFDQPKKQRKKDDFDMF